MKVDNNDLRTIWLDEKEKVVKIIDQRLLPHKLVIVDLKTSDDIIYAIKNMLVRGAPLIGVTGAFGVYLAVLNNEDIKITCDKIKSARPTAVNLSWAVDKVLSKILKTDSYIEKIKIAKETAYEITEDEVQNCKKIGEYGLKLIKDISLKKNGETVNILTHCNAGWLACIEYGTATAPIYAAFDAGINIHVWVDETRPLNQGARLTAWELGKYGIPHTIICDNAGGHIMQHNMVDIAIVGADRVTYTGDAANKIGTYLKALSAKDNGIPFYVALPSSTFDWNIKDGVKEIPIEERNPDEVRYMEGLLLTPKDSSCANFAFDVTPRHLITGFITERGICKASEDDIMKLFPEKA
ncbi:MAG: S-methyl-5-thioribose-1-phosphate isomerase [Desulfobacterales bacterium]|nr:S-methyl-5-thioribose-1-phosphate isomerase [Desulfobacterales bacterium]